jgi:hypothetical protein
MKGSIIDDTTAIGKRLNELTSKQVAVKTATPPPRRLPVCLRCDDSGWMKDGLENMLRLFQSVAKASARQARGLLERKAQVVKAPEHGACVERGAG